MHLKSSDYDLLGMGFRSCKSLSSQIDLEHSHASIIATTCQSCLSVFHAPSKPVNSSYVRETESQFHQVRVCLAYL